MRFQLSRLKSVAHLNEYPVVINSRAYRREHIWFFFFFFADEQMVNTPTHNPSENASENVIFTQYGKQRTNHDFNA